jgi:hypothetical protein
MTHPKAELILLNSLSLKLTNLLENNFKFISSMLIRVQLAINNGNKNYKPASHIHNSKETAVCMRWCDYKIYIINISVATVVLSVGLLLKYEYTKTGFWSRTTQSHMTFCFCYSNNICCFYNFHSISSYHALFDAFSRGGRRKNMYFRNVERFAYIEWKISIDEITGEI